MILSMGISTVQKTDWELKQAGRQWVIVTYPSHVGRVYFKKPRSMTQFQLYSRVFKVCNVLMFSI